MTESMVERVARAIAQSRHGALQDVDERVEWGIPRPLGEVFGTPLTTAKPFNGPLWIIYERDARAAIAAMREPTEAMKNAALHGLWEPAEDNQLSEEWYPYGFGAWLRDYRAMIDAALAEEAK